MTINHEALNAARDIFEIELKINRLSPVDAFEAAMAEYAASLPQDIRALVEELRRGVRPEGRMEGDIELYDIEDANEKMWDAADALSCLEVR